MAYRPRLIPVLLVKGKVLVKSVRFQKHAYVGDPVNAVRLFNDLRADELVLLDIDAYREQRTIDRQLLHDVAEEASMPLSIGGGIRQLSQIGELISAGAEKVVIGSHAAEEPAFVRDAVLEFGSSAIGVCMDVRKHLFRKDQVWTVNGTRPSGFDPLGFARLMEQQGAGEIIVQSIDRDGQMAGYDLKLIKRIAEGVSVPVVALGGAGGMDDFGKAFAAARASAVAAGSAFVYFRKKGSVLINYPGVSDRSW